jgi:polar amino acid transport system ATP-binding protein
MLEIKNLKKNYGDKKVLKGINLTVNKGDIIGIIGPSGCGKSTLLSCINLLEKPTEGEIIFEGKSVKDNKHILDIRRKIGMVFQQFNLFNHMSVLDNIILAPTINKLMSRDEAIKKASGLLKKVDLLDIKDSYPNQISGGQKQRVAIIRTLMMNPEIILFDEPTSALDPEMIGEVTNLMKKLADDGMTMLIVSHELNFIKNFTTRVIYLDDGKIVEEGTSKEIFSKPKDKRLQNFLLKINNK